MKTIQTCSTYGRVHFVNARNLSQPFLQRQPVAFTTNFTPILATIWTLCRGQDLIPSWFAITPSPFVVQVAERTLWINFRAGVRRFVGTLSHMTLVICNYFVNKCVWAERERENERELLNIAPCLGCRMKIVVFSAKLLLYFHPPGGLK